MNNMLMNLIVSETNDSNILTSDLISYTMNFQSQDLRSISASKSA